MMLKNIMLKMGEWEHLGAKEDTRGSKIIAHVPRDFPAAYLHRFFAPVAASDWSKYGMTLPEQLNLLYSECNGLDFFLGKLMTYGLRQHYLRDLSAQFQPFDLKTHDEEHRKNFHPLKGKKDNRVFFASYREDGSGVYANFDDEKVFRCLRGTSDPVNSWPNVKNFLELEFDRLTSLHGADGYLRQEVCTTTPAKA